MELTDRDYTGRDSHKNLRKNENLRQNKISVLLFFPGNVRILISGLRRDFACSFANDLKVVNNSIYSHVVFQKLLKRSTFKISLNFFNCCKHVCI